MKKTTKAILISIVLATTVLLSSCAQSEEVKKVKWLEGTWYSGELDDYYTFTKNDDKWEIVGTNHIIASNLNEESIEKGFILKNENSEYTVRKGGIEESMHLKDANEENGVSFINQKKLDRMSEE